MKAFCCSMNADRVGVVLVGGGDISTLHVITRLVWCFLCTEKQWGIKKLVETALMPYKCSEVILKHKKVFLE